jgi:hypothetical protein
LDKRFSRGLSFLGSYVFSKAIDNVVAPQPGLTPGVSNPFNLKLDKGRGDFDRRHVVAASFLWAPDVRFTNSVAKHFLERWSLGVFYSLQSGAPIDFVQGTDVALNGTGQEQRAQMVAGATYEDIKIDHPDRSAYVSRFFNTAAFVPPVQLPRGIYGTSGRSILSGPAACRTDFAVMKDIAISEGVRIQLRGEFFNAFNQVNFNNPNTNASSATFGRITGAGSGREIQLAGKIIW